MKLYKALALSTTLAIGASPAAYAQDATVTIGDLTWTGAKAIGHVIDQYKWQNIPAIAP